MKKIIPDIATDICISSFLEYLRLAREEIKNIKYVIIKVSIEQLFSALMVKEFFDKIFKNKFQKFCAFTAIPQIRGILFFSFVCDRNMEEGSWELVVYPKDSGEEVMVYSKGA